VLTLSDIKDKVRFLTKEPNQSYPTFATDANITDFANQAQLKIASRTKDRVTSNVPNSTDDPPMSTSAGVRLYEYPDNIMDLYKVHVLYTDLDYIKYDDLWNRGGPIWWKMRGFPKWYYFEEKDGKRMVGLYYTPGDSYPLGFWGTKRPTDMAEDTDSPDFDERLHMAVVFKTCELVMTARREFEKAREWASRYEDELRNYFESGQQTNESNYFLTGSSPSD